MNRIFLWDFDDTLAHSERAVSEYRAEKARLGLVTLPSWMVWHDLEISAGIARKTSPIVGRWKILTITEGRHFILTARVKGAVDAFLDHNKENPEISAGIARIERVISTSDVERAHIPASMKKVEAVRELITEFPAYEFVFLDDRAENVEEMESHALPGVRCILVTHRFGFGIL